MQRMEGREEKFLIGRWYFLNGRSGYKNVLPTIPRKLWTLQ